MKTILSPILASLLLNALATAATVKPGDTEKLFDKIEGEADKLDDKNQKGIGKDIDDLLKAADDNEQQLLKPFIDELKQNLKDLNVEGTVKNAVEGKKESKDEKTEVVNLSRLAYLYTRLFATQLGSESLKKIADSMVPALDKLEKGKDNYADLVKEIQTETKKAIGAATKGVKDVRTKLKDLAKKLLGGKKTEKNDRKTLKDLNKKGENAYFLWRGLIPDLLALNGPDTKNPKEMYDKVAIQVNKLTNDNEKQVGQEIDKLVETVTENTKYIASAPIKELQSELKGPEYAHAISSTEGGKTLSPSEQLKVLTLARIVYVHVKFLAKQVNSEELNKMADELKAAIGKVAKGVDDKGKSEKEVAKLTIKGKQAIQEEIKQLADKLKQEAKELREGKAKADDQKKNRINKLVTEYKEADYIFRGMIGALLGVGEPHASKS